MKFAQKKMSLHNVPAAKPADFSGLPKGIRLALARRIHLLHVQPHKLAGLKGTLPVRLEALKKLGVLSALLVVVGSQACAFRSYALAPIDHRICAQQTILCSDKLDSATCESLGEAVEFWNNRAHTTLFRYGGAGPFVPDLSTLDTSIVVSGVWPAGVPLPARVEGQTLMAFTSHLDHPVSFCLRDAGVFVFIRPDATTAEALQNALRHELGHVLGFTDTLDPTAVMFKYESSDTHSLTDLSDPEWSSLKALYGNGF